MKATRFAARGARRRIAPSILAGVLFTWLLLFSAGSLAQLAGRGYAVEAASADRASPEPALNSNGPAPAGSAATIRSGTHHTITLPFVARAGTPPRPVLCDGFSGTGALAAHTPDICPSGSAWAVKNGDFQDLSGGWARYGSTPYGNAIIDSTLVDLQLSGDLVVAADQYYGLIVRSNRDGTKRWLLAVGYSGGAGASYLLLNRYSTLDGLDVTLPFEYGTLPTLTPGAEYNFTLKCTGSAYRLWINGIYAGAAHDTTSSYLDNTYVGLGTVGGAGTMAWDSITVGTTPDKRMSIFGDSISLPAGKTWPYYIEETRNGVHANHAVGAATIVPGQAASNLPQQVAAAASDHTQIALLLFGTNDWSDPIITDVYRDALVSLSASNPGVKIYVLGILDKTVAENRVEKNGYIAAAVAAARSLGVDATYWSTDGWIDPATETYDGVHPTAEGNAKIAARILALLP